MQRDGMGPHRACGKGIEGGISFRNRGIRSLNETNSQPQKPQLAPSTSDYTHRGERGEDLEHRLLLYFMIRYRGDLNSSSVLLP